MNPEYLAKVSRASLRLLVSFLNDGSCSCCGGADTSKHRVKGFVQLLKLAFRVCESNLGDVGVRSICQISVTVFKKCGNGGRLLQDAIKAGSAEDFDRFFTNFESSPAGVDKHVYGNWGGKVGF